MGESGTGGYRSRLALVPVAILIVTSSCSWFTCITEDMANYSISPNLTARVSETDCSTLGEDASVTVRLSDLSRKITQPVFRYTPSNSDILPNISAKGDVITIGIESVSSIYFGNARFSNYKIIYDVKEIDYS
jgi:hypothetical protein